MKLVIFGLRISSSWGNGHATIWRGLCRALAQRKHRIIFFERDVPYYALHRDFQAIDGGELILYRDWPTAVASASRHLADAEVAMVTSSCPDGVAASELVHGSRALKLFYDLDTPVTLEQLGSGTPLSHIGADGLRGFDLVLSNTGGKAAEELCRRLGARRVAPLYAGVDPAVHHLASLVKRFRADLSYIATYAEDRQASLEALFLEPARRMPDRRFLIAGAKYPPAFNWLDNLLLCASRRPAGSSRALFVVAAHAERDPTSNGAHGLLPIRAAF